MSRSDADLIREALDWLFDNTPHESEAQEARQALYRRLAREQQLREALERLRAKYDHADGPCEGQCVTERWRVLEDIDEALAAGRKP